MSTLSLRPGSALAEEIGGRYRVLARLGRGGSAYVYQVREIASGLELALKRLRHDLRRRVPPSSPGTSSASSTPSRSCATPA